MSKKPQSIVRDDFSVEHSGRSSAQARATPASASLLVMFVPAFVLTFMVLMAMFWVHHGTQDIAQDITLSVMVAFFVGCLVPPPRAS